jgi:hypothetical protein
MKADNAARSRSVFGEPQRLQTIAWAREAAEFCKEAEPGSSGFTWAARFRAIAKYLVNPQAGEAETCDRLCDSNWIAGAQFGWNCGDAGDDARLNEAIAARQRESRKMQGRQFQSRVPRTGGQ